MGAEVIDRLIFALDGDLSALKTAYATAESGAQQAGRNVADNFNKPIRQTGDEFAKLGAVIRNTAAAFGVAFTAQYLVSFTESVIKSSAELEIQAKTIGVSTDALQAYHIAAIQSGAGAELGDMAIRRFTRAIGEAFEAVGPARKAFIDLFGSSEAALKAIASPDRLALTAAALQKITDVTERFRIEQQIFSRGGSAVESLLKAWADPKLTSNLTQFNSLTEKQIKDMEELNKRWEMFGLTLHTTVASGIALLMHNLSDLVKHPGLQLLSDIGLIAQPGSTGGGPRTSGIPFAGAGGPQPHWGLPGADAGAGGPAPHFTTPNMDKFLADQRVALELAGETNEQRVADEALIKAANAQLQDLGGTEKDYVSSVKEARGILGGQANIIARMAADTKNAAVGARTLAEAVHGAPVSAAATERLQQERATSLVAHARALEDQQRRADAAERDDAAGTLGNKARAEAKEIADANWRITVGAEAANKKITDEMQAQLTVAQKEQDLKFADATLRAKALADLEVELEMKREVWLGTDEEYQKELAHRQGLAEQVAALKTETTDQQMWGGLRTGLSSVMEAGVGGFANMRQAAHQFELQLIQLALRLYVIEPLLRDTLGTSADGPGGSGLGAVGGSPLLNTVDLAAGGPGLGGGGAGVASDLWSAFAGIFDSGGSIGPGQWGIKSGMPEILQGGTTGISLRPLTAPIISAALGSSQGSSEGGSYGQSRSPGGSSRGGDTHNYYFPGVTDRQTAIIARGQFNASVTRAAATGQRNA